MPEKCPSGLAAPRPGEADCAGESRGRIIVVDDHPLFRRGLVSLLDGRAGISVCAHTGLADQALELIASEKPDMATIEISLGKYDGLRLIKEIHEAFPYLPMLVISMHCESSYAERSIKAGARGYVSKREVDETVFLAICQILRGEYYFSHAANAMFTRSHLHRITGKERQSLASLSDRQLEVFRLIGESLGTRQIAERLNLSVKTVESHREHIKCKLTLHSGAELARAAATWILTGNI